MNASIALILSEDGTVRDITLLASNSEERKRAHQLLFIAQDEIELFEGRLKERVRSLITPSAAQIS